MPIRRFKTMLLSQYKQYGVSSGKTVLNISASGGTVTEAGGYRIHTFTYSGSDQLFDLETDGQIDFFLWGAAGGGSNAEGYSDPGGPGGFASGSAYLGSGSYVIQVGQGGGRSTNTARPSRPYPNGGLPSVRNGYLNGAGGGRSAVFDGLVNANNALIVAGGGGGAAGHGGGASSEGGHGGGGGGTNGLAGVSPNYSEVSNGGTQSSGGTTDSGSSRTSGQLAGADAGNGTAWSAGWNAAGGGGDGWYGGGAVNNKHHGGGGGSGYLSNSIAGGTLQSASSINNRVTTLNPPQTSNQYYQSGVARGNLNSTGGNGLVVIRYSISNAYIYD